MSEAVKAAAIGQRTGHAADHGFSQPGMSIGAGHEQIRSDRLDEIGELFALRPLT